MIMNYTLTDRLNRSTDQQINRSTDQLHNCLTDLHNWLTTNDLLLNSTKT